MRSPSSPTAGTSFSRRKRRSGRPARRGSRCRCFQRTFRSEGQVPATAGSGYGDDFDAESEAASEVASDEVSSPGGSPGGAANASVYEGDEAETLEDLMADN